MAKLSLFGCVVLVIFGIILGMLEEPAKDALQDASQERIEAIDNLE